MMSSQFRVCLTRTKWQLSVKPTLHANAGEQVIGLISSCDMMINVLIPPEELSSRMPFMISAFADRAACV